MFNFKAIKPEKEMGPDTAFWVVVDDLEGYETRVTTKGRIIETWKDIMFFPPGSAPEEEVEAFEEFASNLDNWREYEGIPSILVWDVGGESSGTISFFRCTT